MPAPLQVVPGDTPGAPPGAQFDRAGNENVAGNLTVGKTLILDTVPSAPIQSPAGLTLYTLDGKTFSGVGSDGSPTAFAAASGFTKIDSKVLVAPAASITIAVPAGYLVLQGYFTGRADDAQLIEGLGLQFNGDTGNHYQWQVMQGSSNVAAATSDNADVMGRIGLIPGTDDAAGFFGGGSFTVNQPGGATNKIVTSITSASNNLNPSYIATFGVAWDNTNVINSITLAPTDGANLIAGSSFTLYGLS